MEVFERFGMRNNKPMLRSGYEIDGTHYKQMVGSSMYLIASRPNPMYVVCLVNRYMERLMEQHPQAIKRILRYLNRTIDLGILYRKIGSNCFHWKWLSWRFRWEKENFKLYVLIRNILYCLVIKEASSGKYLYHWSWVLIGGNQPRLPRKG